MQRSQFIRIILILNIIFLLGLATIFSGFIQNFFIIASLIVFNFYIYDVLLINKKKMLILGLILTVFFIILIYVQYFNAVSLGFNDGLLSGFIGKNQYNDTNNYYYESIDLARILKSTDLKLWIAGNYPFYGSFGPYNAYNIFNAILIIIFGNNLISLILLKLFFSVASIYILYKITSYFVKNSWALLSIIINNLFPGYLLVVSTLSRDSIILFLMIYTTFLIWEFTKTKYRFILIKAIPPAIGLLFFRNYAFAILFLAISILFLKEINFSFKTVRNIIIIFGIAFIINSFIDVPKIIDELSVKLLGTSLLEYKGEISWGAQRAQGFQLIFYSLYYMFFGGFASAKEFVFNSTSEILNYTSYLYLNLTLPFTMILLIFLLTKFKELNKGLIYIFFYMMPFLFLTLIIFIFGWPIPRLYNMWFWVSAVLIAIYFDNATKTTRIFSIVGIIIIVSWMNILRFL